MFNRKNFYSSAPVWNRNFRLLIGSTICGSAGAIAASYGLSFLVFYETGSVLASALVLASKAIPSFLLPLIAGPFMDRLPRKPVLVFSDLLNGVLYLLMGVWLSMASFTYLGYLIYSLVLACASSLDELAFTSILPMTITPGQEQRSYAVSGMVYPFLNMVMMPCAAFIMERIGIPFLLLLQGALSLLGALIESRMHLEQDTGHHEERFSLHLWKNDLLDTLRYLHHEPGLLSFFIYAAFTNGIGNACGPVLVAFTSITPGFTPLMFSMFGVADSLGRLMGNTTQYFQEIPSRYQYPFSLLVMMLYNILDGILLFLSYPLMLVIQWLGGTMGSITYTLRTAAIQSYIPESMRARINSFQDLLYYMVTSILTLIFGFLGDFFSPRTVMVIGAVLGMIVLGLTWVKHRKACQAVFLFEK